MNKYAESNMDLDILFADPELRTILKQLEVERKIISEEDQKLISEKLIKDMGEENQPKFIYNQEIKYKKKWYLIVLFCACLLLITYSVYQLVRKPSEVYGNQDASKYAAILSTSEKKEWETKKAKPREVFMQLNTKIVVIEGEKIDIRLINPPYSRYRYQVKLTLKGEDDVLYQSSINPGTVYEYVKINKTLSTGGYNAVVSYQFFDGDEKLMGSNQVDVTLTVK